MTWFDLFWVTWAVLGGAVEVTALIRKAPDDTLSEHVWDWLRVRDPRPTVPFIILRVILAIACVWLAVHFPLAKWSF
jgi:hypothetical protein